MSGPLLTVLLYSHFTNLSTENDHAQQQYIYQKFRNSKQCSLGPMLDTSYTLIH
jgi:hypothetical protein